MRKKRNNLCQNCWFQGRDPNPGSAECEAGADAEFHGTEAHQQFGGWEILVQARNMKIYGSFYVDSMYTTQRQTLQWLISDELERIQKDVFVP
jgi:hypothetical protein